MITPYDMAMPQEFSEKVLEWDFHDICKMACVTNGMADIIRHCLSSASPLHQVQQGPMQRELDALTDEESDEL